MNLTDIELNHLVARLFPYLFGAENLDARRRLQEAGITVTRSDFYSEIPLVSTIIDPPNGPRLDRIFPDNESMVEWVRSVATFAGEFDPPMATDVPTEYAWEKGPFGYSDAIIYYCLLRHLKPRLIVEIGAGVSSLVAAQAIGRNGLGHLKVIEPYPSDFLAQIPGIEIVKQPIQDVDLDALAAEFEDGDVLFIDSTHTVKFGSDVLNIYLDLLPCIEADVHVHAHDIYLPGPIPAHMMLDHQVYWNEQYLLYAYLLRNPMAQVLYGSRYHYDRNPDVLEDLMAGKYPSGGASFWWRQSGLGRGPQNRAAS